MRDGDGEDGRGDGRSQSGEVGVKEKELGREDPSTCYQARRIYKRIAPGPRRAGGRRLSLTVGPGRDGEGRWLVGR